MREKILFSSKLLKNNAILNVLINLRSEENLWLTFEYNDDDAVIFVEALKGWIDRSNIQHWYKLQIIRKHSVILSDFSK